MKQATAPTQSKDYSRFKFIDTNRALKTNERLKTSMKVFGWMKSRPMIVNPRFEIIDGQHRLMIARELEIPVYYSVEPTDNRAQDENLMITLNKTQSVWNLSDYIQHHATKGVAFHKEVKAFEEEFRLGISNSISLCASGRKTNQAAAIRDGKDLRLFMKRRAAATFIHACKSLPFYKTAPFVTAIKMLYSKANPEQIQKVFKKHMTIKQQAKVTDYLAIFENIINKGTSVNKISFQ